MADASAALLLRAGTVDSYAISAAADLKQREGGTLGEALVRLGLIDEERLLAVFQQGLLVPRISGAVLQRVPKVVLGLCPPQLAVDFRVLPVELDSEGNLTLAMADPADNRAVDEIAALTQRFVMRAVAPPSAIREALLLHYRSAAVAAGIQGALPSSASSITLAPPTTAPSRRSTSEASTRPSSAPSGNRAPTTMGAVSFPADAARPASAAAPPTVAASPPVTRGRSSGVHAVVTGSRPRRDPLPPAAQLVPEAALPKAFGMNALVALTRAVEPVTDTTSGKVARKPRSGRTTGSQTTIAGESELRPKSGRAARTVTSTSLAPAAGTPPSASKESTRPAVSAQGVDPSLQAPVSRLQGAQSRDEVVAVLLDYASQLAARVGLFVVQQGQLTCLDGRGPDHVVVAMKWFTIPVDTPSPFRDVLNSRKAYMGSLEDSAESRAFRNALGSSPGELLLLPLLVGDKVVGILYADELKADLQRLSRELETLSQEAGAAFARIILSRKRKS